MVLFQDQRHYQKRLIVKGKGKPKSRSQFSAKGGLERNKVMLAIVWGLQRTKKLMWDNRQIVERFLPRVQYIKILPFKMSTAVSQGRQFSWRVGAVSFVLVFAWKYVLWVGGAMMRWCETHSPLNYSHLMTLTVGNIAKSWTIIRKLFIANFGIRKHVDAWVAWTAQCTSFSLLRPFWSILYDKREKIFLRGNCEWANSVNQSCDSPSEPRLLILFSNHWSLPIWGNTTECT
jgi:hypothetical protein